MSCGAGTCFPARTCAATFGEARRPESPGPIARCSMGGTRPIGYGGRGATASASRAGSGGREEESGPRQNPAKVRDDLERRPEEDPRIGCLRTALFPEPTLAREHLGVVSTVPRREW